MTGCFHNACAAADYFYGILEYCRGIVTAVYHGVTQVGRQNITIRGKG